MKNKLTRSKNKTTLLVLAALVLVGGSFSLASGVGILPGPSSMFASLISVISGNPTVFIGRDGASPSGALTAGKSATLAIYDVSVGNVSNWATLYNVGLQIAVTSVQNSPLTLSNITMRYDYCINPGKNYGYNWISKGCGSINIPSSLVTKTTAGYTVNFNTAIPIYPQQSYGALYVMGTPGYAYTGTNAFTPSGNGTLQVKLTSAKASGDQCSGPYSFGYGYTGCKSAPAIINIQLGNARLFTIVRPYGYGYRPALPAPTTPSTNVSVSPSPSSQNVALGATGVTMANFVFDATNSSQGVNFIKAPFQIITSNKDAYPKNCTAWDGASKLTNTPLTPTSDGDKLFTFNLWLGVPKGGTKTLTIKCDIPSTLPTGRTIQWALPTGGITGYTLTTSATVNTTKSGATGAGVMTVGTGVVPVGTYTITLDPSSPAYTVAAGGQSNVTLGILKIHSTNDDVVFFAGSGVLPIKLTSGTAASLQGGTMGLYNSSGIQVGTAIFAGSASTTLANFTAHFMIPANTDARLTIKANLANIGTSQPGPEGALLKVDYNNAQKASAIATGLSSRTTAMNVSTSNTAVSGVRVLNSYPLFAKDSVPTNTLSNGDKSLYRFKVTASPQGDVGIGSFAIAISPSATVTVVSTNVYVYTDSNYSAPVFGLSSGKIMPVDMITHDSAGQSSVTYFIIKNPTGTQTVLTVPAGKTYYFDVRGTLSGVTTGSSVSTSLRGDINYPPSFSGGMFTYNGLSTLGTQYFLWSPLATTTSLTTNDWTNGYGLVGLPGTNMSATVLSL